MEKKYVIIDAKLTGKRLKKVFKDNGYSVRQIQHKLDLCCSQSVYRWLDGTTLPSLTNLYMLSQILGQPMESLLVVTEIIVTREY